MSRTAMRGGWDLPVRVSLLEEDADSFERGIKGLATQQQVAELKNTMQWMTRGFFAVVLSIIGALAVVAFK